MRNPKATCPACNRKVDRVDGEYARHYVRGELCLAARREITEERRRVRG